jgi:hypothetical protein
VELRAETDGLASDGVLKYACRRKLDVVMDVARGHPLILELGHRRVCSHARAYTESIAYIFVAADSSPGRQQAAQSSCSTAGPKGTTDQQANPDPVPALVSKWP